MSHTAEALFVSVVTTAAVSLAGAALVLALARRSAARAAGWAPLVVVGALSAGVAAATWVMLVAEDDYRSLIFVVLAGAPLALIVGVVLARRVAVIERDSARAEQVAREQQARHRTIQWLSHDLRTPLAGIRVLAESVRDGVSPDPDADLDRLLDQVDRLDALVGDVFALAGMTSGDAGSPADAQISTAAKAPTDARSPADAKASPTDAHVPSGGDATSTRATVCLDDLVSDAVSLLVPLADARSATVAAAALDGADVDVHGSVLLRAVLNILRNALAYSPPGSTITIRTWHDERHAGVDVVDACGGIPESDLPRLLEAGWRGDRARTEPGTGLGLAIASHVAQDHGGAVTISNLADGSGCHVRLSVRRTR